MMWLQENDVDDEPLSEFALPKDDYGDLMDVRRFAPEGSQSPSAMSNPTPTGRSSRNRRYSTMDDTDGKHTIHSAKSTALRYSSQ